MLATLVGIEGYNHTLHTIAVVDVEFLVGRQVLRIKLHRGSTVQFTSRNRSLRGSFSEFAIVDFVLVVHRHLTRIESTLQSAGPYGKISGKGIAVHLTYLGVEYSLAFAGGVIIVRK